MVVSGVVYVWYMCVVASSVVYVWYMCVVVNGVVYVWYMCGSECCSFRATRRQNPFYSLNG